MSDFLTDLEFDNYRKLIYDESGIHFSNSNRTILESRLKERLRLSKIETPKEYYNKIKTEQEEMKILLDSVTTNLTRFFRNAAHYQTFENYVIPNLIKYKRERNDKMIRIWSAGCSTGEEPYTNAMVLKEKLPSDFTIEVTASDLSLKSLMIAKEGFYPDARVSGIPEKYLNKYFSKQAGGYQVKKEIKDLISFDYHNLKFESGKHNLDIVFCRNVLIYFDEVAQKAVVDRFWRAMGAHSFIFIGHSESLFGMNTKFEFIKTDWACIYGKQED